MSEELDAWGDLMTEEEVEAYYAARSEKKLAHLNGLDQATKDQAIACYRRVGNAVQVDRSIRFLKVPKVEYDAWIRYLTPFERYQDNRLASEGIENTLCRGIPIAPVVSDD